jgi:hypothetical protein
MLEPGEISRAISIYREERSDVTDNADFRKMVRFLSDQILVAGYADLN